MKGWKTIPQLGIFPCLLWNPLLSSFIVKVYYKNIHLFCNIVFIFYFIYFFKKRIRQVSILWVRILRGSRSSVPSLNDYGKSKHKISFFLSFLFILYFHFSFLTFHFFYQFMDFPLFPHIPFFVFLLFIDLKFKIF